MVNLRQNTVGCNNNWWYGALISCDWNYGWALSHISHLAALCPMLFNYHEYSPPQDISWQMIVTQCIQTCLVHKAKNNSVCSWRHHGHCPEIEVKNDGQWSKATAYSETNSFYYSNPSFWQETVHAASYPDSKLNVADDNTNGIQN